MLLHFSGISQSHWSQTSTARQ